MAAMSKTIADFADVDTATLEAALLGESTEPRPVATSDLEQAAEKHSTSPVGEPSDKAAGGDSAQLPTTGQQGSSPSPEADTPPASASEPEPQPAEKPEDEPEIVSGQFDNLAEDEARALEIRKRNPDLTLDASLYLARQQLGINTEPQGEQGEPEPTLEDRINAIEAQLDEAGANDGLFTSEIANLTKEHARLLAEQAVERANQVRHNEARTAVLRDEREASYQRAASICPEALDSNTAIGQALSAVIAEAEAMNNPLLYDPQAPELFLALANARLPEAQRVELKRPAATSTNTPSEAHVAAPAEPAKPSPAGVLPVAASARTAQPATQLIDPANIDRAIKETPTDILEAALLGQGPNKVLLRL